MKIPQVAMGFNTKPWSSMTWMIWCTLWYFDITIENGLFIVDLHWFTHYQWWCSIAILVYQRVPPWLRNPPIYPILSPSFHRFFSKRLLQFVFHLVLCSCGLPDELGSRPLWLVALSGMSSKVSCLGMTPDYARIYQTFWGIDIVGIDLV